MSATSARGARAERRTAKALGTTRVHRKRGESAPDVEPIRLPCGTLLQAESKARSRLPHLITRALEQARGYTPGAVPLVAVFQRGQRGGLAFLDLADFARLVGLDMAVLPEPTPLRRPRPTPPPRQLNLFQEAS